MLHNVQFAFAGPNGSPILTSQTSKYEATPQLASPCGEVRRASFLVPRTSHEASQPVRIVNEASELSIAQTRLAPNSPRLGLSHLVAISGCILSKVIR